MSETDLRTIPDSVGGIVASRRGRRGRRVFTLALVLLLTLALANVLGGRESTVTAQAGGQALSVTYPSTTRGGLHVDLLVTVEREGGFARPVTLALPHSYLSLFDEATVDPQPASESSTGERVLWAFAPPPGERLRVRFDARIHPDAHRGRSGYVAVVADGAEVVRAELVTRVMP